MPKNVGFQLRSIDVLTRILKADILHNIYNINPTISSSSGAETPKSAIPSYYPFVFELSIRATSTSLYLVIPAG